MSHRDHFRAVATLALDFSESGGFEQTYDREDARLVLTICREGGKPGCWKAIYWLIVFSSPGKGRAVERCGLPGWRAALAAMLDGDANTQPLWPDKGGKEVKA